MANRHTAAERRAYAAAARAALGSGEPGVCYLIHASIPVGNLFGMASHYAGWGKDWRRRVSAHRSGNDRLPNLVAAFRAAGADLLVVRLAPGDRNLERVLKYRGHFADHCWLCCELAGKRMLIGRWGAIGPDVRGAR